VHSQVRVEGVVNSFFLARQSYFGDMPIPTGETIQLSPEKVAELARNTLKPSGWKCEWVISSSSKHSPAACSVVLGSWNAYLKVDSSFPFISFFSSTHESVILSKGKKILYLSIFIFWLY
jgi:hypothetical protein